MYKKKVSRLNKENFPTWHSLMKLYLVGIGDGAIHNAYVEIPRPLTTKQMKEKQEHNYAMLEIASALIYTKFDNIKECTTAKKMWDTL